MYNLKFARNKNISSLYNSAESTMLLARSSNQSEKCQREKFYNTLLVCHQDNITKITLNRPERKNAINEVMFAELMDALDDSATDDSVLTVITGNGEFFSSGIDLSILLSSSPEDIKTLISPENIQCFIKKFIDFPKPVVAVINGPTIGIFVTLLCLFDLVFTTEKATFQTLFSQLALCPEGCSTYTFPLLMGPIKANEMLLFNKKLTAQKALDLGLVNEVFPDNTFQQDVWTKLKEYAALPRESLALSKQLIRGMIKDQLYTACVNESDRFIERWKSEEFKNAFFLKIKSKL